MLCPCVHIKYDPEFSLSYTTSAVMHNITCSCSFPSSIQRHNPLFKDLSNVNHLCHSTGRKCRLDFVRKNIQHKEKKD